MATFSTFAPTFDARSRVAAAPAAMPRTQSTATTAIKPRCIRMAAPLSRVRSNRPRGLIADPSLPLAAAPATVDCKLLTADQRGYDSPPDEGMQRCATRLRSGATLRD